MPAPLTTGLSYEPSRLTIVVHASPIEGATEFVYHASFKEPCAISHWNSRGETVLRDAVAAARSCAAEAGYKTWETYEIVEL